MSDREAFEKWIKKAQTCNAQIVDHGPVVLASEVRRYFQAAQAQAGDAVGYVVPISGEYQFFRSYDTALHEREEFEYYDRDNEQGVKPQAVYTAPPAAAVNQQLLELLKMALVDLEAYEIQSEGEFGQCRTLEQLEAAGFLPESIIKIRAAIEAAQEQK